MGGESRGASLTEKIIWGAACTLTTATVILASVEIKKNAERESAQEEISSIVDSTKNHLEKNGLMNLNDDNFREKVQNGLVLVNFYPDSSEKQPALSPMVDKLSSREKKKIKVGRFKVEGETLTAEKYNIANLPTLILFKEGREVGRIISFESEEDLFSQLQNLVATAE